MTCARLIRRSSLQSLFSWLLAALVVSGEAGLVAAQKPPAKWEMLKGCRLVTDEYRDGDSFHVTCDGKEFVFRLYFVDAPETDEDQKDRVGKQRRHFGVTPAELKKGGETARKFTAEQLKRAFTVTTRWQNAGGRGRLPRYYAFVTVGGSDLGELLVNNGLARAYGEDAILPSGMRAKDHRAKLHRLEREAKANRLGIWENSNRRSK